MKKQEIIALVLFIGLGLVALQVKLTHLAGSSANFTLFDSFAPMAAAILGLWFGLIALVIMPVANALVHGTKILTPDFVIRLIPMLFAAWYFQTARKANLLIPVLCIVAFLLNPVGRSVWYFSLFWTIPIICYLFRERGQVLGLVARSLGATFTAHAVGGAIWIYAYHLPKAVWQGLIPVVVVERLLFAAGLAISFLAIQNILAALAKRRPAVKEFVEQHDLQAGGAQS